jgi:hypothetical protein
MVSVVDQNGYACDVCHDQGCGQCCDLEQRELEDERGGELGDPRRCPIHPSQQTSSSDGFFDAPCGACEAEQADDGERWAIDPENPRRTLCGSRPWLARTASSQRYPTACNDDADNIPF